VSPRFCFRFVMFTGLLALAAGCARTPSPTVPGIGGSIGVPHAGVLTNPSALGMEGPGYRMLRDNDRRYGLPRFVQTIERAAASVAAQRPGPPLVIGDLSTSVGGETMPHFSHRTGRDVDLLFYLTTLDGIPVRSPGFDEHHGRYLRIDLEREWLLVRALLLDEDARIQWIFVSRVVSNMLTEWAKARGEAPALLDRAAEVMAQPQPGGIHDDHLHVRTACAPEDIARGCEPTGPTRSWHRSTAPSTSGALALLEGELVLEILRPLDETSPPEREAPLPVASLP
jgi:penicillin-insensitive murein endopeptidase